MAKKKTKKKNAGPPKPLVQLSQCMIVKNEEKNIERALSWAKPIAFEQIVVDTGSTDRTVEIAERMGAKVFHFEWINDFSAAKNFALEQAKGNWVAFLDADEYFTPEDAKHLLYCLKRIMEDPEMRNRWHALNFPLANLNEKGEVFAVVDQERVFRSFVRYTGKIHERIDMPAENVAHLDEVTVMHTGYAGGVIEEKRKSERNVEMLRDHLKYNPDDINSKVYLADSLQVSGDPESLAEAEMLFYEAIRDNVDGIMPAMKRKAYLRLITRYDDMEKKFLVREDLCLKALRDFPGDIDFNYYLGATRNTNGDFDKAWEALQECERSLSDKDALTNSEIIAANPALLYEQLAVAAQGLEYLDKHEKYTSLMDEYNR